MAISPTRSGQCRGADSRARRRTCGPYRPPLKRHRPPICHCEEANGRRGNLGKAVAFSPMAFPRCDCVLRDCHVASLLAMTHQVVRRCTSALLPLNGSVQGGHYPQGARRIRKAAKPPTAAQGTPLQSNLAARAVGDGLYGLQLPSRDCHVALLLAMTHQVVRRCTSALLPLNGSVQGGHYPQGARRIRKAAKPPTAAQGTPLQTQSVGAFLSTPCTNWKCLPEIATSLRSSQ